MIKCKNFSFKKKSKWSDKNVKHEDLEIVVCCFSLMPFLIPLSSIETNIFSFIVERLFCSTSY